MADDDIETEGLAFAVMDSQISRSPMKSISRRHRYNYTTKPCVELEYRGRRYQFDDLVGHGKFAYCFRYTNTTDGRDLVAKVSQFKPMDSRRVIVRTKWEREVRFLKSMNHPNIVRYYACFTVSQNNIFYASFVIKSFGIIQLQTSYLRYILMEYIHTDLRSELSNDPEMALPKVRGIMEGVFTALQYLHGRHIVHRDIKLRNILLNAQNQVKVCDFGLAKQLDAENQFLVVKARSGGTLLYLPPELLVPNGYLTPKADVWSAAVVMYNLLFQIMPFGCDENHPEEVINRITACSYFAPNFRGRSVEDMMPPMAILQRIFIPDRDKRPTADAVLNFDFFQ